MLGLGPLNIRSAIKQDHLSADSSSEVRSDPAPLRKLAGAELTSVGDVTPYQRLGNAEMGENTPEMVAPAYHRDTPAALTPCNQLI